MARYAETDGGLGRGALPIAVTLALLSITLGAAQVPAPAVPEAACVTDASSCPVAPPDCAYGWGNFTRSADNDDFACATAVRTLPFRTVADLTRATLETGEPNRNHPCWPSTTTWGDLAGTLWYRFTPRSNGTATFDARSVPPGVPISYAFFTGSSFDTISPKYGGGCASVRATGGAFICNVGETIDFQIGVLEGSPRGSVDFILTASQGCEGEVIPLGGAPSTSGVGSQVASLLPPTPCVTDGACPPVPCVNEAATCPAAAPAPVPCTAWGWLATAPMQGARPVNDDFDCAAVVHSTPFSAAQELTGSTLEPGEPNSAGVAYRDCGQVAGSVWYRWTPTLPGTATVTTVDPRTDSLMDTTLLVTTGDGWLGTQVKTLAPPRPAYSTLVDCNDDARSGGPQATVTFDCASGQTYMIRVGAKTGTMGTAGLRIDGCDGAALPIGGAPTDSASSVPNPDDLQRDVGALAYGAQDLLLSLLGLLGL